MQFTKKLRLLMKRRRFTQEPLAQEIGVSQNKVSLWANGKNVPDLKEALALARALDVDVNFLADDDLDEMPPALSRDQDYILRIFRDSGLSADVAARRMIGLDIAPPAAGGDAGRAEPRSGPKRNETG